MLSSQNIREDGAIDFSSPSRYVSLDDFERENSRTDVRGGDVLLTIVASLGRSAVVPDNAPAFALQRSVAVIRTGLIPSYLAIFLRSPVARAYYDKHGKGTAQRGIYLGKLGDLPVLVPPIAEQSRIVARVDELMRLCDALEVKSRIEAEGHARLLDTLLNLVIDSDTPEEVSGSWHCVAEHFDQLIDRPEAVDAFEQTILKLAVRGLLAPQDPNDESADTLLKRIEAAKNVEHRGAPGSRKPAPLPPVDLDDVPFPLPAGWAWSRLGDIAAVSGGVTLGRKGAVPAAVSLPYLRVANVQRWRLDLSSMKSLVIDASERARYQLAEGDLLITEGGDWDKVGRTAIWRSELPVCLHQNHVFKARGLTPEWNPEWAELCLNSDVARAYFSAKAKQTTNLASINMTELKLFVFPVPPAAEQRRLVARVTQLRRLCADLRQRLEACQAVRSQLADALVEQAAA